MTDFRLTVDMDPDEVKQGPNFLRILCQKEVTRFDEYLRATDPQFREGLAKWERLAIEGYLYQKTKGHLDAHYNSNSHSMEEQNGAA